MSYSPWTAALLAGLIGLLIGSFLNVVIHRLPRMMQREWLHDVLDSLSDRTPGHNLWHAVFPLETAAPEPLAAAATAAAGQLDAQPPLTLSRPRSHCGHCRQTIRWYDNIPVLSYLLLRGRCRHCGQRYGLRYALVELLTGLLFAACGWHWGLGLSAGLWAVFCAALVALLFIDWDTTLLPDSIVLPLLWLGLLASAAGAISVRLTDAVWGAAGGYLVLWSVCALFKRITGKQGMGHGDFKLLAALGAWLGWQALIPIVLMSSIIGALGGIALKLSGRLRPDGYFPFGPFLVCAGWVMLLAQIGVIDLAALIGWRL